MKTHLFIGAGEAPSERTKRIMDLMVEVGYSVQYEQLATRTTQSETPTIIIWDEMLDADSVASLEALYGHPVYFAERNQLPPIRNFDGIHPCEVERVIPKNTQGMGPRNKWGKLR